MSKDIKSIITGVFLGHAPFRNVREMHQITTFPLSGTLSVNNMYDHLPRLLECAMQRSAGTRSRDWGSQACDGLDRDAQQSAQGQRARSIRLFQGRGPTWAPLTSER